MATRETIEIRPQPGPQEAFLSTPADIAIFGGGAYGGKTWSLLLEPLRHVDNPEFGAVIFRRTTPQITNEGGLWDESTKLYPLMGAMPIRGRLEWRFPSGAKIRFAHLEYDSNVHDWQGSQIALLCFDEITHFTAKQFWYMFSRNRSMSGVRPYVRATCNPDPDSFVAELIAWWIDQDTGYAIPERAGVIRWFVRLGDDALIWADTREELVEKYGEASQPKSLTFIPASYTDNRLGLEADPGYVANLNALSKVDRERLKYGNWKIRPAAGAYFQRRYFEIIDAAPAGVEVVRFWDQAASKPTPENPDPDWTAGLKVSRDRHGIFYIEHENRFRGSPREVDAAIQNTAKQDGAECTIGLYQDPGQAGKYQTQTQISALAGYVVKRLPTTRDKETMAKPVSSQAEAGNVKLVRGHWNDGFLSELENFPDGSHDDRVDALSGAFSLLLKTAGETAVSFGSRFDRYAAH